MELMFCGLLFSRRGKRMSFLSSLLQIFTSFTVSELDGFQFLPVTQINSGSVYSQMANAVNYADSTGKFFLGQALGSSSLSKGTYTPTTTYQPGGTMPPVAYPTHQPNGYVVPTGTNPASMYSTSAEGVRHIKYFEGFHQRPYIINGQKYIGFGHHLSMDDTTTYISSDQADSFLAADVSKAEGLVKGAISSKISQEHFDAMVDFAYTTGSAFSGSNVVSSINSGDFGGACTALANWCYGKQNGVMALFPHLLARATFNVHKMTPAVDPQPPV